MPDSPSLIHELKEWQHQVLSMDRIVYYFTSSLLEAPRMSSLQWGYYSGDILPFVYKLFNVLVLCVQQDSVLRHLFADHKSK